MEKAPNDMSTAHKTSGQRFDRTGTRNTQPPIMTTQARCGAYSVLVFEPALDRIGSSMRRSSHIRLHQLQIIFDRVVEHLGHCRNSNVATYSSTKTRSARSLSNTLTLSEKVSR